MIDLVSLEELLVRVGVRVADHVVDRLVREKVDAPLGMLTRRDLARRLGVSQTHVSRLAAEGMPSLVVGDESTRRYDLDAVRAWLAERAPKATTPAKDPVNVDAIASRAGLKRVS